MSPRRVETALPERRESVSKRLRMISENLHRTGGGLFTTLANGGDPYELPRLGLARAIQKHVAHAASSNNFLSFSANRTIAEQYAHLPEDAIPIYDLTDRELWQRTVSLVFALNTTGRQRVDPGLYVLTRYHRSAAGDHVLALVDCVEYLQAMPEAARMPDYADALTRAKRDAEWLVYPLDRIEGGETLSALVRTCENFTVEHFEAL